MLDGGRPRPQKRGAALSDGVKVCCQRFRVPRPLLPLRRSRNAAEIAPVMVSPVRSASSRASAQAFSFLMLRPIYVPQG